MIGQTEFEQKYGKRGVYVARPLPKVDGRELLHYALEAAQNARDRGSDFGVLGKGKAVCSERALFGIARATGINMTNNRRLIDVTPGDFFDANDQGVGVYFTIWGLGSLRKAE